MRLLRYELKKALSLPVLWVFFGLCLALNILLAAGNSGGRERFNDTSAAAGLLGHRVDGAFLAGLSAFPPSENRDSLLTSAGELSDVFAALDTGGLAAYYEAQFRESPLAVSWIHKKYDLAAERVTALAASGAGMELYAGDMTWQSHQLLFGTLFRSLTAEASVLGALAALYLTGCERLSRTVPLLCAARAGRKQWLGKAAAGTVCALVLWLLLAAVSFGVYFALWDYGGIWASGVSGGFNYVDETMIVKPFITWGDFTVAGYFAACLGMSAALTAVCSLSASCIGILTRNTYAAALVMVLLCAGGLAAAVWFADERLWPAYIVSCFQPAVLWLDAGIWFTESGMNTVLPWQEPVAVALWLTLGLGGTLLAYRRFAGKDIA